MQAILRFAIARDDDTSVVLDEEPSAFDQERWRRRLPAVGETVVIGEHRCRVRSRTSRAVAPEDGCDQLRAEIEFLLDLEEQ